MGLTTSTHIKEEEAINGPFNVSAGLIQQLVTEDQF